MGGNVFKNKTQSINKEDIEETVNNYFTELKKVFPKKSKIFNKKHFHYLGSVGKKPQSGDIDFGIDVSSFVDKSFSDKSIREWGIDPESVKAQFVKLKKRSRTATDKELMVKSLLQNIALQINSKSPNIYVDEKKIGPGTMFSLFPQFSNGRKLDYGVQMDWMVGRIELLKFSYYSSVYKGNVKGLHRTQLVLSMFQNLDISFTHAKGITDKKTGEFITDDPKEMVKVLEERYGISLDTRTMNDYFKLMSVLKNLPKKDYDNIVDIYLKILDKTRADVPEDLQDEYRARKKRLGLTGKFLPDDSKLLEQVEPKITKIKSFKSFVNESRPTRQLKNLTKDELVEFLYNFIYKLSDLDVTEKLAGQMLGTKYDSTIEQTFIKPKAVNKWFKFEEYNFHRDVCTVLDKFFKYRGMDKEINFEVLSEKSHDFINYDFTGKIVVDFTGVLTQNDKKYLNKDKNIKFLTKEDIRIKHKRGIHEIENLFQKWKEKIQNTKTLKELRSLVLPEIEDKLGTYIANEMESVINSSAMEGLFMKVQGKDFKLPNKIFKDLQRANVPIVNIMKMAQKVVLPRIQNTSDRLVTDMIKFLQSNIKIKASNKYKRLMTQERSKEILNQFIKTNDTKELYYSIREEVKN